MSPSGGSAPNCTTHIQADDASFGSYSFYVASFYFRSPSFVSSDFPDKTEVVPKVPDAELLIVWSNAMRPKACVETSCFYGNDISLITYKNSTTPVHIKYCLAIIVIFFTIVHKMINNLKIIMSVITS